MTEEEIKLAVDEVWRAVVAKGLKQVSVIAQIERAKQPVVLINWYAKPGDWNTSKYEWCRADLLETCFDKARVWAANLPSPEETKFRQFMETVAAAVEMGKENGIDLEFVNPLAEMMKRLSGNALAPPQPAPEPDPDHDADLTDKL